MWLPWWAILLAIPLFAGCLAGPVQDVPASALRDEAEAAAKRWSPDAEPYLVMGCELRNLTDTMGASIGYPGGCGVSQNTPRPALLPGSGRSPAWTFVYESVAKNANLVVIVGAADLLQYEVGPIGAQTEFAYASHYRDSPYAARGLGAWRIDSDQAAMAATDSPHWQPFASPGLDALLILQAGAQGEPVWQFSAVNGTGHRFHATVDANTAQVTKREKAGPQVPSIFPEGGNLDGSLVLATAPTDQQEINVRFAGHPDLALVIGGSLGPNQGYDLEVTSPSGNLTTISYRQPIDAQPLQHAFPNPEPGTWTIKFTLAQGTAKFDYDVDWSASGVGDVWQPAS